MIQQAEQERDVLLRELNESRTKADQLRMTLMDSKSNSESTYKSLLSSEQSAREANAQLRKYCQKLMLHLSEVQAELGAQSSHQSQKNRDGKERERDLQQRLDILAKENQHLHDTRLVQCIFIINHLHVHSFTWFVQSSFLVIF